MKSTILGLIRPTKMSHWASDILIFIPRFVGGALLSIDFGASKFGVPWSPAENELALLTVAEWFPEDVANFGAPFSWAPVFFAWMAAASETIGGVLLALGLATRVNAALIACTMLVAIFFQKWGQGTWSMLPAMGFLWLSFYTLVIGSGRIGLDYLIARKLDS